MATVIFTALGTALGGPLGGALGSLIGHQLDRAVFGGAKREGPRLKEVQITTSSYGTPLARHYGTMRAAGSVIWATDLKESSERSGGKGKPSTTTYSYSASFAVALASRPILRLGRIWADGNLLRGEADELKTGGELRVYEGHGDQPVDPLIASDRGAACPAFRGRAYCVFESLQLADFGNRIPALSFEIVADDGEVTLAQLVERLDRPVDAEPALAGLGGFSDEGGPLAYTLSTIDDVYPLACDAGGDRLSIVAADVIPAEVPLLPEPAVDLSDQGFGALAGQSRRRQPDAREIPDGLRYYDTGRDYQAGLQRADGRARPGRSRVLEFPGALAAWTARDLANAAAERAGWSNDTLAWRVAELDPALAPGTIVRVPGHPGHWRIDGWEWRDKGVELELRRLPRGAPRQTPADPGDALSPPDLVASATELVAFELPWDGIGAGDTRQVYAALSSASQGWRGAALYADQAGDLVSLGSSGTARSVIGRTTSALAGSPAVRLDRTASLEIELASVDFLLSGATPEALAGGANRALLGNEVVQFAEAVPLGGAGWLLRGLLRGRGGTEQAAQAGHASDTPFVLLDGTPLAVDPALLGPTNATTLVAIGLADDEPVTASILSPGSTLRPLTPVHPRVRLPAEGGLVLQWTRRARGVWNWPDWVEAPLNEPTEAYVVGLGDADQPVLRWELALPQLELSAVTLAMLVSEHPGQPLWVRQVGRVDLSAPLLLLLVP